MFFFFNDTATTEIYTLSLHDALPISARYKGQELTTKGLCSSLLPSRAPANDSPVMVVGSPPSPTISMMVGAIDRKSTRLNSSHANISYAVFCLKKKKNPLSNTHLYNS